RRQRSAPSGGPSPRGLAGSRGGASGSSRTSSSSSSSPGRPAATPNPSESREPLSENSAPERDETDSRQRSRPRDGSPSGSFGQRSRTLLSRKGGFNR